MKYTNILQVLVILILLMGCEKEYEPINKFSDFNFTTTFFGAEKSIQVGQYMSYSDLSIGTTSHSWSFSNESGMKFLKNVEIPKSEDNFYPYIDSELGVESTNKTVHVLYTKAGKQKIHLQDTFEEYVSFEGVRDTLEAVKVGSQWVIDTTFTVEVFDSVQVAMTVFDDDVEILNVAYDEIVNLNDSASWTTYEISSGKPLTFVDMTVVGQPNSRTWNFKKGTPETSSDSIATVIYYKPGVYVIKLESERTGDSEDFPSDSNTKYVPLKVKVTPSNEEVVISGAAELQDNTIQISTNALLDPLDDEISNFTVHVSNPNGYEADIPVATAKINEDNASIIELKLQNEIYNSDIITISYSGKSIETIDGRKLPSLSGMQVIMYDPNLLDGYRFEDQQIVWESTKGTISYSYATDIVSEGEYSLKFENNASKSEMYAESNKYPFSLVLDKKYSLSYKIYLKDVVPSQWQIRLGEDGNEAKNFHVLTETPSNDMKANEWIEITKSFESPKEADVMKLGVRLFSIGVTYFDDFKLKEIEERPL